MDQIMKESVYIETTIPSFYFETRTEPEMISRRNWTREWWNSYSNRFDIFISEAVIFELEEGDYPAKEKVLSFIEGLSILSVNNQIEEIAEIYIKNHLMPKEDVGDALHLAIASYHKCDFLLTWNCRHLANANKFRHIKRINERLDLFTPSLIIPLELFPEENDEGR